MGADQFLLTWNNHRSNLAEVFTQLRTQDQLVDVTLMCDGGSYPAHRLVLAACSPYFHQLFTKLPTQHPLVYLRDVRQTELEALLEFIYRGEVSVANSELSGLIKIAESLRIKGLGDVSKRDPSLIVPSSKPEKRSSASLQNPSRPKKSQRFADVNGVPGSPMGEETPVTIPRTPGFGYGVSPMLANCEKLSSAVVGGEGEQDSCDSYTPPFIAESKLRSCLEVPELPLGGLPFTNLLSQFPSSSRLGSLFKRTADWKKSLTKATKVEPDDPEMDNNTCDDLKEEGPASPEDNPSNVSHPQESDFGGPEKLTQKQLYEAGGDLGNAIFSKYTQLLTTFHQHQQLHQLKHQNAVDEESPPGLSTSSSLLPLVAAAATDQHSIAKDAKSLRCHLCGATIKHIANFRRHMKQHLNPRRFPCPWCSAAFGRKDNLKTHTRKHHPAEMEAQDLGSTPTGPSSGTEGGSSGGAGAGAMEIFNGLVAPEGGAVGEDEEACGGLVIADGDTEEDAEEDGGGGRVVTGGPPCPTVDLCDDDDDDENGGPTPPNSVLPTTVGEEEEGGQQRGREGAVGDQEEVLLSGP